MSIIAWIVHLAALVACLAAPLPAAWALAIRCRSRPGAAHLLLAALCGWMLFAALAVVVAGLSGPLTVLRVVAVAGMIAWIGARSLMRDRRRAGAALATVRAAIAGITRWSVAEKVMFTAIAGAGIGVVAAMVATPSGDYDTWMYQLPQVAEWIQHRSLDAHQEQWQEAHNYARGILFYPGDWTAVTWLATAPLGRDTLSLLPNLAAWLVLGLATRGLALRLGADRTHALAGAGLAMLMPLAAVNLHSAHVDLALGAQLAAMLYFVAEGVASGGRAERWLAIALGGLLIGTKMSGTGMLAAPLLLGAWLWRARQRAAPGREPALAALAVVCVLVLGLSWYARNWMQTGNPLGFVAMHVFGHDLPGVIDRAYIDRTNLLHAFQPLRAWHWWLLGGSVALFCAPVVALAAYACARVPALARRTPEARALLAVTVLLAWLYIAGPWSAKHAHDPELTWWLGQQLRYTFAWWAVVAALAAGALGSSTRLRWLMPGLVVASALAFPFQTTGWVVAVPVAAAGALALVALRRCAVRLRWFAALAVIALALAPAVDALRWNLLDHRAGGVPTALERTLAPCEPIAFWGSHQSWLLYGRDLRRPVHYLDCEDLDAARLAAIMRARGCAWIALGAKWHEFDPGRYRLVEDHPELFTCTHGDPAVWGMCLYHLVDGPADPR